MRETCSEGKISAVKPGSAIAASLICPEPLLDFQEVPKSSRIQLKIFPYMNFIAFLKKRKQKTVYHNCLIDTSKHIHMYDLSFGCFSQFVIFLELFLSFLGKVSEIFYFAKTLVRLGKIISIS